MFLIFSMKEQSLVVIDGMEIQENDIIKTTKLQTKIKLLAIIKLPSYNKTTNNNKITNYKLH